MACGVMEEDEPASADFFIVDVYIASNCMSEGRNFARWRHLGDFKLWTGLNAGDLGYRLSENFGRVGELRVGAHIAILGRKTACRVQTHRSGDLRVTRAW